MPAGGGFKPGLRCVEPGHGVHPPPLLLLLLLPMRNPQPPSSVLSEQNLKFWYAPVTYTISKGVDGNYATYRVRGDKSGHVCSPRTGLEATSQTRLFDACQVATSLGAPGGGVTPESCIAGLNAMPDIGSTLPFPPFRSHSLLPMAGSCPAGKALASRFGECVACEGGQIKGGGTTCKCPANRRVLQVGTQACGLLWGPVGQATSVGQAAEEVCSLFTERLDELYAGIVGDSTVVAAYVDAFLDSAAAFLDRSFI